MKMEQILAKCPKCGNLDKKVLRKFLEEHESHGEMNSVACDKCGHIFEEDR